MKIVSGRLDDKIHSKVKKLGVPANALIVALWDELSQGKHKMLVRRLKANPAKRGPAKPVKRTRAVAKKSQKVTPPSRLWPKKARRSKKLNGSSGEPYVVGKASKRRTRASA